MQITVVGAGNMGLAMVGYMAVHCKGDIILFTGKNILDKGKLHLHDLEIREDFETNNFLCTDNPEVAFCKADIIFVTYPAFLRKEFIEKFGKYLNKGAYLGFVPGYGGAEYSSVSLLEKGVVIFGFQRVPYVARAYNVEQANILSKKNKLFIGAIPQSKTKSISEIVEKLLDIPVQPLKEYLSITLAPSNPLLHITGLYNVFKNYKKGDKFNQQLKFYEEWDDNASKILFEYDRELQEVCKALSPLDMSEVVPLPIYYESSSPEKMTLKLKSIESFKSVLVPLKYEEQGYVVDLNSRMFIEDYPYGVCIIKDFALLTGVSTPTVDLLLEFYHNLSGHKYFDDSGEYTDEIQLTGIPSISGLNTIDKIVDFYHRDRQC
jgi:hypothetical protein